VAVDARVARSMLGQWVDCYCADGVYSGVLREVRRDGIVLEMPRRTARWVLDDNKQDLEIHHAICDGELEGELVQFRPFFFNPFLFFIPFFLLFALRRRFFF
jgi:hypothetical protein